MKPTRFVSIVQLGLCLSAGSLSVLRADSPSVYLSSPGAQTVPVGARLAVAGHASDGEGDMQEHWLEVHRPSGGWSWEGWLTSEPWGPQLWGDAFNSNKSTTFTVTETGTYTFRTTAIDAEHRGPGWEEWVISNEVPVSVVPATRWNSLPVATLHLPVPQSVQVGTTLQVHGQATDINGTMSEHWLEVRRPAGDWSWEGWLTGEPWAGQLGGDSHGSTKSTSFTLDTPGTYVFRTTAYDPDFAEWVISQEISVTVQSGCTPAYEPWYWNDGGQIQWNNNCYNYSNNRRTDTFAQPGRAGGDPYDEITAEEVSNGAIADGLVQTDAATPPPPCMTKIALVIWPGIDYHWYRQDSDGSWSHKPGGTQATNLDAAGQPIADPFSANRGNYSEFVGYFLTPAGSTQGQGSANIY